MLALLAKGTGKGWFSERTHNAGREQLQIERLTEPPVTWQLRGTLCCRPQEMLMLSLQQVMGSDRSDSPAGARVQPDNSYSPRIINLITHLPDLET